jgi:hypothetical protein
MVRMRGEIAVMVVAACGGSSSHAPDAARDATLDGSNAASDAYSPMPIGGGGIRGGAIDGQLVVFAIDDLTRTPIAGATVTVGSLHATTDASGIATVLGVMGAQSVVVTADGHVPQLWVGIAGRELTVDLGASPVASPDLAFVDLTFSQLPSGDIAQAFASALEVSTASAGADPPIASTTDPAVVHIPRTVPDSVFGLGPLRTSCDVVAWVYDQRGGGLTGAAIATGLQQSQFVDLQAVPLSSTVTPTVDPGTPPAGLTTVSTTVGLETANGILPSEPSSPRLPSASMVAGATYALTAGATDMQSSRSAVFRHGFTTPAVSAGTWLDPPASVTASASEVTWSAIAGASMYAIDVFDPQSPAGQRVLQVRVVDGSTSVVLPAGLPAMPLRARVSAIAAAFDLSDLELDRDRPKVTAVSSRDVDF